MNKNLKYVIIVLVFVISIIISLTIFTFLSDKESDSSREVVSLNLQVKGNSMYPTISDGNFVSVIEDFDSISRGDIIVINILTRDESFIKRVIAIGGDEVIFGRDGFIYVNSEQLVEEYIAQNSFSLNSDMMILLSQLEFYNNRVPNGFVLAMGDNREESIDSRAWGLINTDSIIGKVLIE